LREVGASVRRDVEATHKLASNFDELVGRDATLVGKQPHIENLDGYMNALVVIRDPRFSAPCANPRPKLQIWSLLVRINSGRSSVRAAAPGEVKGVHSNHVDGDHGAAPKLEIELSEAR
jgi:hypothetical protein